MVRVIKDATYGFISLFNDVTGEYLRGIDRKDDPFMAEYPHLIDIGVMGGCEHGRTGLCMKAGIKCYQNGLQQMEPNMTLENFKKIIDWSKGRMFEAALGGRGDVDMHEHFEELLQYARANGIVPNFTTSGFGMTPEKAAICKRYCGAVAVSMYSRLDMKVECIGCTEADDVPVVFNFGGSFIRMIPSACKVYHEQQVPNYTMQAIQMLLDAGVKTNIHYVLSNTTIDEALLRLQYNGFPEGINAVIFLLHKPVGLGTEADVLHLNDSRVQQFFELVDRGQFSFKIGFDSCSIPGVLKWSKHIDPRSIDTCEGSRFSMYITSDMKALPCSFDNQNQKYAVVLSDSVTIEDAWNSAEFNKFRDKLRYSCPGCSKRSLCMGGCPLERSIVLCDSKERAFFLGRKGATT